MQLTDTTLARIPSTTSTQSDFTLPTGTPGPSSSLISDGKAAKNYIWGWIFV